MGSASRVGGRHRGGTSELPFVSEEEVRYLVREGAAKGIFEKVEEQLVHTVFELADSATPPTRDLRPVATSDSSFPGLASDAARRCAAPTAPVT